MVSGRQELRYLLIHNNAADMTFHHRMFFLLLMKKNVSTDAESKHKMMTYRLFFHQLIN